MGKFRKTLRAFGRETSCHGLRPAILAEGVAKVVWTVVFLGALGGTAYQLVAVFQRFLSYSTSTSFMVCVK